MEGRRGGRRSEKRAEEERIYKTERGVLFSLCFFVYFFSTGEYLLLHENFGFTAAELVKLIDNGFSSTFLNASQKYTLRNQAAQQCVSILHEVRVRRASWGEKNERSERGKKREEAEGMR